MAVTVHMVATTFSSLPYSDAWTEVNAAVRGVNPLSPGWLWQQHNEHRLVLPKLFLAADFLFFRYRQMFCLASILLIQAAHLVLLSWALRSLGPWRGAIWRTAVGVIAFCFFCPSQWENFVWGFQTCFVLPGLLATLSFVGLVLCRRGDWKFLVLSVLAALGAQYSLANGNLLWPLLVAGAFYLGLRGWQVLAYVLSGLISCLFFFHNYGLSSLPDGLSSSIHSPFRVAGFALVYLGSTWTNHAVTATLLGGLGLAIALLLTLYLRSASHSHALYVVIVLTLLFCAATALTTAIARLRFGLEQALAPRYQTPALLFWAELFLLLLLAATEKRRSATSLVLIQLCLLAVFSRGAYLARYPIRQARWHGFQLNAAGAALLSGIDDPQQFHYGAVDSRHIAEDAPYLQQHALSIFAADIRDQPGTLLTSTFSLAPAKECTGAVQSVSGLASNGSAGNFRITGWAWDLARRKPLSHIVVVADGRVAGLGASGDWRPEVRAVNRYMNTSFIGFTAYAKNVASSTPIEIYASDPNTPGRACYIATAHLPPAP